MSDGCLRPETAADDGGGSGGIPAPAGHLRRESGAVRHRRDQRAHQRLLLRRGGDAGGGGQRRQPLRLGDAAVRDDRGKAGPISAQKAVYAGGRLSAHRHQKRTPSSADLR